LKFVLIGPVYPYRGGIAHYTTVLARTLRANQHQVLLISFLRQYPQWLFPGRSDRDLSQQPLQVDDTGQAPNYWIDSLNPFTWLTTFGRIRHAKPDVLVLQWWTSFWAPIWLTLLVLNRLFLRSRVVIICHNVLPHDARRWDRWLAKAVLRWANRIIVQSEAEQARLASLMEAPDVCIVPLPVFAMFTGEVLPRAEARRRLDLPAEAALMLFFGIVRRYKGLADLLVVLAQIRAQLDQPHLLIAGEFWEDKQPYLEMIERLQLADIVTIHDHYIPNETLPTYFAAADVLVTAHRQKTGSGAIQMATGFGLPVVMPPDAPNERASEASVNGTLDHATHRAALAQAMLDYWRKPATYTDSPAISEPDQSWVRLVDALLV